ncbi:MAG: glycosyltransferase [Rhodothermales bacterium]|nr:glycosyltransferase [Rhodothermales bacterium]
MARPTVVENVPPFREVAPSGKLRSAAGITDNHPIVLHQGHIKQGRGCEALVRAALTVPDTHFVFLGNGPLRPALQDLARSLDIQERVHFVDSVPPELLLDYTASATVGVTLLEDTCLNHHYALPNKLFEYLMAGVPVLASDLPEISRIVSDFRVGRLCQPGSTKDIGKNLREMLSKSEELADYRANSRQVFETINWQSASERFLNEFRRLLKALP